MKLIGCAETSTHQYTCRRPHKHAPKISQISSLVCLFFQHCYRTPTGGSFTPLHYVPSEIRLHAKQIIVTCMYAIEYTLYRRLHLCMCACECVCSAYNMYRKIITRHGPIINNKGFCTDQRARGGGGGNDDDGDDEHFEAYG